MHDQSLLWGSLHKSADPDQWGSKVDSQNPDCVYSVNRRSRFTSVLRVAFEHAKLTQYDLYSILKRDTICARLLLMHTCTYALVVVFKSTAYVTIYAV